MKNCKTNHSLFLILCSKVYFFYSSSLNLIVNRLQRITRVFAITVVQMKGFLSYESLQHLMCMRICFYCICWCLFYWCWNTDLEITGFVYLLLKIISLINKLSKFDQKLKWSQGLLYCGIVSARKKFFLSFYLDAEFKGKIIHFTCVGHKQQHRRIHTELK